MPTFAKLGFSRNFTKDYFSKPLNHAYGDPPTHSADSTSSRQASSGQVGRVFFEKDWPVGSPYFSVFKRFKD
jgi:hypothetical protein